MGSSGKGRTIDQHLGERIAALREDRDVSLAELALAAGLTIEELERIERGQDRASARALHLICTALDCRVADLFSGWPR